MQHSLSSRFRFLPVLIAFCLAGLALLAFAPALQNGFIGLDDSLYVYGNRRVLAGLTWEGLQWAFSLNTYTYWHPATWLSLMLDTQLFGVDPWGYHLTNVLLHLGNILILFAILFSATRRLWASAAAAALFAIHPIHVESVAWITARKDVLSLFFVLLSILAYVNWARSRSLHHRLLSCAAFALALLAKPAVLTLPFALLLLDVWPLNRPGGERREKVSTLILEKLPYFAFVLLVLLMVFLSHPVSGTTGETGNVPLLLRLQNIPVAYATYLKKLLWPDDLAVFYSFPIAIPLWKTLGALVLLAGIAGAALTARKSWPAIPVGGLFFLVTMFPMIGLVQAGLWPALADRYAYLPFLGLYAALAFGLADMLSRWIPRPLLALGFAALLSALIPVTRTQVALWGNTESLFRQATINVPNNWMAYALLGKQLSIQKQFVAAEQAYRIAIAINPQHVAAYSGLGATLEDQGRIEDALEVHREAVRRNPHHPMGYTNLAWALERNGRHTRETFQSIEKAMQIAPDWPQPHIYLGNIYRKQKKYDAALKEYLLAEDIDQEFQGIHLGMGLTYLETDRFDDAIQAFATELRQDEENPVIHSAIGFCFTQLGKFDDALPHLLRATQLTPDSAESWNNLGVLYAKMGRLEEAQQALEKALDVNPDFERARVSLEKVHRQIAPAATAK